MSVSHQFDSLADAEKYFGKIYAPFKLTPDQLKFLTINSFVEKMVDGEKKFVPHYDPAIANPFIEPEGGFKDLDMWAIWRNIECTDVLVLRGELSDICKIEDFERMKAGKGVSGVTFSGFGHAPPLMNPDQIAVVSEYLNK
eukprot:TRINITY_DN4370_c0_g1_i1.p1 TRINITY_DN4370_c0_g1~~TRINITY_DN4370_c0_g1_i1.p1  ORF type:complete len:160 (+),score=23.10 TRINITY_DN4370_c0_g1_i1:59-481(+)